MVFVLLFRACQSVKIDKFHSFIRRFGCRVLDTSPPAKVNVNLHRGVFAIDWHARTFPPFLGSFERFQILFSFGIDLLFIGVWVESWESNGISFHAPMGWRFRWDSPTGFRWDSHRNITFNERDEKRERERGYRWESHRVVGPTGEPRWNSHRVGSWAQHLSGPPSHHACWGVLHRVVLPSGVSSHRARGEAGSPSLNVSG
ncbi:hypothetical protein Taro_028409 [Colocasia esculenta]|uniref:Uncharacterized protein n=1 Tax=Colocasia esculenta TaxID=4460 RepID=A0A843VB61_COLES|nr:hypothetical protein [Colocasia esculenta]